MNNIKITFLIILIALSTLAKAQVREVLDAIKPKKEFKGVPAIHKKSQIVQVGIGTPNNVASLLNVGGIGNYFKTASSKAGPVFINYEYLLKDNLGIGASVIYAKASQTYKNPFGSNTQSADLSGVSILLSTTYHFYTTNKLDPYSKAALGVTIWKGSYKNQDGSDAGNLSLPAPVAYSNPFSKSCEWWCNCRAGQLYIRNGGNSNRTGKPRLYIQ